MNKEKLDHRMLELRNAIRAGHVPGVIKGVRDQLLELSSDFLFWEVSGERKHADIEITVLPRFSDGDTFLELERTTISANMIGSRVGWNVLNQVSGCIYRAQQQAADVLIWSSGEDRRAYGKYLESVREGE